MPKSKKLWIMASRKEEDKEDKLKVLMKALEQIPDDVDLWKEAISLQEPEEAKKMLYEAVKCVPKSTDLWLALAKLEDYQHAR